jgi:hypothetical protein
MNCGKYKPYLKEYLRQKGVDVSMDPTRCFNAGEHKCGDKRPSLQIWNDGYKCYGCGIQGDIYDAVRFFEKLEDIEKQYEFLRALYGA